jgi:outer membrane protein assembly factor BamD
MIFLLAAAIVLLAVCKSSFSAQTFRLTEDGLQAVEPNAGERCLLDVANVKNLLNEHKTQKAAGAIEKLKADWPQIAGSDIDAFFEAELLYCKGKFIKAVRAYDGLLDKFPESELYQTALQRQFRIGQAFLAGRKFTVLRIFRIRGYEQGRKIMDKITDRAGDTEIALKAALAVAQSLEKRKKFGDAYQKWSQISATWPQTDTARTALLAMARCKHATYRGPKYDASGLVSAKTYYENFNDRYPQQAKDLQIDKKLEMIDEQLAYKQLIIGRYYKRTGNITSANLYFQMVLDESADTSVAQMAQSELGPVK